MVNSVLVQCNGKSWKRRALSTPLQSKKKVFLDCLPQAHVDAPTPCFRQQGSCPASKLCMGGAPFQHLNLGPRAVSTSPGMVQRPKWKLVALFGNQLNQHATLLAGSSLLLRCLSLCLGSIEKERRLCNYQSSYCPLLHLHC